MIVDDQIIQPNAAVAHRWIELEFARTIFDAYCKNPNFIFQTDFVDQLPDSESSLFEQIRFSGGVHGPIFQDLLTGAQVGRYTHFTNIFARAYFFFHPWSFKSFTMNQIMDSVGLGPYYTRLFVIRIIHQDQPIRKEIRLLGKEECDWMRKFGYYVPPRLTRYDYWKYELTYIHGDFKT